MRPSFHARKSRRNFLKSAGAAALAPLAPRILPASALGADGATPPSERISLGLIGIGMVGQGHLRGFLSAADVQVVAVCDVDRWRRENAQSTTEQAYAERRTSGTYRGCAAYLDLRELLARDDLDAVFIATGDRWHGVATVMAAKAGKDVYVEKPISLTVAEARAMVRAVRRYDRVCQCGLQQRSTREFRLACQLVRDGAIGKIQEVYVPGPGTSRDVNLPAEPVPDSLDWDLWLGPSPWRPFNHRFVYLGKPLNVVPWDFCRDFGGGSLTSGTVHAFDVVQWGLGIDHAGPFEVIPPAAGIFPDLTYRYPDGVLLRVVPGRLDPKKHAIPQGWDANTPLHSFGALFVGERGWIDVGREGYLRSFPADLIKNYPADYEPLIAGESHHRNWFNAIRSRNRPACDVAVGCQSTIVSHLGCIAYWTGRALKWDPAAEQFLGDDEANRLLFRALREPWRV
ncbi:MAG: Gfo/Idh/MocA family oxidoreductase [Candidatus Anammoximicrobium sp.]|nr:Gfo/Idh/MocA family oxidoreductase [Candidatus Anammoximicrobium sp.]